jgi:hypothetical protein
MNISERYHAKNRGDVRYFTGKPCKNGHVAERYTSTGRCVDCHKEYYSGNSHWNDLKASHKRINKAKYAEHEAHRRAAKKLATPSWYDKKKCILVYEERDRMTETTGVQHHVDHIYPLQSDWVCGLHVHENLQVLTGPDNASKGNR